MRFNVIRTGLALGLALFTAFGLAQTQTEEHWSPYDYPKEIPEGVEHHIIADGDTLWAIAGQYFGDPLLWPQLYQANSYIQDPDLIYPGDPLMLNIGTVVTDDSLAGNTSSATSETDVTDEGQTSGEFAEEDDYSEMEAMQENAGEPEAYEEEEAAEEVVTDRSEVTDFDLDSSEFVILPAGDRSDMECSTYLYPTKDGKNKPQFDFKVSGGETLHKEAFAFDEVLFLNQGRKDGIKPGEVYSVRRILRKVYRPGKSVGRGKYLGLAIDQMGKVRILAVQDNNSTAIVTASCQEIQVGDFLVPYEQEPIPLITELPVINRWSGFRKDLEGSVCIVEENLAAFGKGHTVAIDFGIERNIAPGDLFIVYRDNPYNTKTMTLPDVYLGHAVALKVGSSFTVVKIIEAYLAMRAGDKVVPLHGDSFLD